jgi:hypothetical protein
MLKWAHAAVMLYSVDPGGLVHYGRGKAALSIDFDDFM